MHERHIFFVVLAAIALSMQHVSTVNASSEIEFADDVQQQGRANVHPLSRREPFVVTQEMKDDGFKPIHLPPGMVSKVNIFKREPYVLQTPDGNFYSPAVEEGMVHALKRAPEPEPYVIEKPDGTFYTPPAVAGQMHAMKREPIVVRPGESTPMYHIPEALKGKIHILKRDPSPEPHVLAPGEQPHPIYVDGHILPDKTVVRPIAEKRDPSVGLPYGGMKPHTHPSSFGAQALRRDLGQDIQTAIKQASDAISDDVSKGIETWNTQANDVRSKLADAQTKIRAADKKQQDALHKQLQDAVKKFQDADKKQRDGAKKKAADDKKKADDAKKAADDKKKADDKKASDAKKAADDKKKADDKKAADDKKKQQDDVQKWQKDLKAKWDDFTKKFQKAVHPDAAKKPSKRSSLSFVADRHD